MLKKLASVIAAVALMATGAASLGCFFFIADEPKSCELFND